MRILADILFAVVVATGITLSSVAANAADDEGKITRVDVQKLTITLDNGNTYKLSGEFDVESLEIGTEVVLAYDTIAGEKTVTDLVTME